MKNFFKSVQFHAKQIAFGILDRKLTIYSSSSCFFMFIALVPILMIICCLLPYTPLNQAVVIGYIDEFVDRSISHVLHSIINAIYRSDSATLTVSIFLTLFSASFAMKAVMKGMDSAYGCKNNTNIIVYTLRSLIYMVALVITMLIAFIIMVLGARIFELLQEHLPDWHVIEILQPLLSKSRYLNVMVILFVIFLIFYWLMPDKKVRLVEQIPGAAFSAIIWVIFSGIFSLYVSVSGQYGAYGVIGSVMLTMLWGNMCLLFLLIGGFLNSYISDYRAENARLAAEAAAITEGTNVPGKYSEDSSEYILDNGSSSSRIKERYLNEEKESSLMPIITGVGAGLAAIVAVIFFILFKKSSKKLTEAQTELARITEKPKKFARLIKLIQKAK